MINKIFLIRYNDGGSGLLPFASVLAPRAFFIYKGGSGDLLIWYKKIHFKTK